MITTPRAPLLIAFLIVAVPTVAILFVVAIQAGPAVLVLLVVCVGLLSWIAQRFASSLFGLIQSYATAKYQHAEQMANKGVLVVGRGFPQYNVKQAQLSAPVTQAAQLAPPAHGIQFDSASMDANAINLLLYSCQLLGRNSNRIASNPECAAANIPGYNGRKWDAIINKHLKLSFDIATVPGPVENGGGAFVPPEIGTVGALYDILLTRNNREIERGAVNALPEVKR